MYLSHRYMLILENLRRFCSLDSLITCNNKIDMFYNVILEDLNIDIQIQVIIEQNNEDKNMENKTKQEKLIDVLFEERKKLIDFKNEIKQYIESHVASDLNDDGVLMIVEKMAIQRMLEENEQVDNGHISLKEYKEKHNKLFDKYSTK